VLFITSTIIPNVIGQEINITPNKDISAKDILIDDSKFVFNMFGWRHTIEWHKRPIDGGITKTPFGIYDLYLLWEWIGYFAPLLYIRDKYNVDSNPAVTYSVYFLNQLLFTRHFYEKMTLIMCPYIYTINMNSPTQDMTIGRLVIFGR